MKNTNKIGSSKYILEMWEIKEETMKAAYKASEILSLSLSLSHTHTHTHNKHRERD
jgi:hypothetical protein